MHTHLPPRPLALSPSRPLHRRVRTLALSRSRVPMSTGEGASHLSSMLTLPNFPSVGFSLTSEEDRLAELMANLFLNWVPSRVLFHPAYFLIRFPLLQLLWYHISSTPTLSLPPSLSLSLSPFLPYPLSLPYPFSPTPSLPHPLPLSLPPLSHPFSLSHVARTDKPRHEPAYILPRHEPAYILP